MTVRLPALFCLLFLITGIRGDDFDLGDAIDPDPTVPVKPTPEKKLTTTVKPPDAPKPATTVPKLDPKPDDAPKPATSVPKLDPKPDDGFHLDDALGGDDMATTRPKPDRGGGGAGGSFSDDDLFEGGHPKDPNEPDGNQKGRALQPSSGGGEDEVQGPEKQSVIAGVLSALGVAAVGAVSSFIAYQKKKLCFKGQAEDPENVNMDNQKGDQNDPQAQMNLLAK